MNEERFRLQIEQHPETRLLQTLQLAPQHAVRVLQLFDDYYLLERVRGEQRAPLLLDEEALCHKLVAGGRLEAAEIRPLLPPEQGVDVLLGDENELPATVRDAAPNAENADPLQSRLRIAMAHFMEQNPSTAQALRQTASSLQLREQTFQAVPDFKPEPPTLAKETASQQEESSLEALTSPVVYEALQRAAENQQELLAQVQHVKSKLERQSAEVFQALSQLPQVQERLDALRQRLEDWQSQMELHHVPRDSLLERTAEELTDLQGQLQALLSEGLALQKLVRERRFDAHDEIALRLECLEDMLEHVVQERHWVYYLQQQHAFRDLEQQRIHLLSQRHQSLSEQKTALQASIEQLEQINREILAQDPLAVPEPVPALALHELQRLEYELQVIEADPALNLLEDET